MTTFDVPPPIEDQRVRFYLDHFAQIEEWAALRKEAVSLLHEAFLTLADSIVTALDGRQDLLVRTADLEEGGYPRVILERPDWRGSGEDTAPYGIALEWERAVLNRQGQLLLYVGVRGNPDHPRYAATSDMVREAARGWKRTLGTGWGGTSPVWPCFRWIRPSPGQPFDEVALMTEAQQQLSWLQDQLSNQLSDRIAVTEG